MKVEFYTRPNCGLCDEAKLMLSLVQEEVPFTLIEHNIEERDDWTEEYGLLIPVVKVDGEVVQYGKVDYVTLSKRLQKIT
ncbi:glutaredoxin family protein [Jeotgalibacillus proteolyticus]|uniref:NrdH-redoxin n=1 Tax=Jeotgalibacillus proteolyticus TaxID=2082395 RepID=A0A2S5GAX0_9BACL|nr:glutaredoxin family protein [Jeotgalibacillus proteolyticus]PPA70162.1 NrdH-redoxin [Jeotgalibacillus proteolyticus]